MHVNGAVVVQELLPRERRVHRVPVAVRDALEHVALRRAVVLRRGQPVDLELRGGEAGVVDQRAEVEAVEVRALERHGGAVEAAAVQLPGRVVEVREVDLAAVLGDVGLDHRSPPQGSARRIDQARRRIVRRQREELDDDAVGQERPETSARPRRRGVVGLDHVLPEARRREARSIGLADGRHEAHDVVGLVEAGIAGLVGGGLPDLGAGGARERGGKKESRRDEAGETHGRSLWREGPERS